MRVTWQQQACISGVLCVKLHLRSLFFSKYTIQNSPRIFNSFVQKPKLTVKTSDVPIVQFPKRFNETSTAKLVNV